MSEKSACRTCAFGPTRFEADGRDVWMVGSRFQPIPFRRRPNFHAWHLRADSKSAFATSLVGSRSPPLTTSFGISAFGMSRGTHPPTLPMSSRMHHFPNRRPPDHRIAHTYQRG